MGTFHQFCSQLVQTYFNIAEVEPSFTIIDDIDAKVLQHTLLDKIIARSYDNAIFAINTFCATRSTEPLKELLIGIYNFLCSREDGAHWLDNMAGLSYCDINGNLALENIIKHFSQVGKYYHDKFTYINSHAQKEDCEKLIPFIDHALKVSKGLSDVRKLDDFFKLQNQFEFTTLKKSDFSLYEEFKQTRNDLKEEIKTIKDYLMVGEQTLRERLERDSVLVGQIIYLLKEFVKEYSQEKLRLGKLDFSDLEIYAQKVLSNQQVLEQLRNKYKFIFVDEYQDTNPVQDKILSQLKGESPNRQSENSYFLVGDIKQSIYGFRGAEPKIFAAKLQDDDKVVKLNENFRSNPKILEFVNQIFCNIMTKDVVDICYKTTSEVKPGANFPNQDGPSVEIMIIDTKTEKVEIQKPTKPYDMFSNNPTHSEIKKIEAECAILVKKIDELTKTKIYDLETKTMRKVRLNDIAILARNSTHFNLLTQKLAKAGIESIVASKNNASDLFETAILENFLFAISNFHNDLPLVMTMTNFLFGFTNEEIAQIKIFHQKEVAEKTNECVTFYSHIKNYIANNRDNLSKKLTNFIQMLEEFYTFSRTNSVTNTINKFLTQFQMIEKLLITPNGETMAANIHSYINRLSNSRHNESLPRFLYLLENNMLEIQIGEGGSTRDRVQIMTIHKSKGLEFPIVILFDTGAKFSNIESRKFMVIDKDYGLCVHSVDLDNYQKNLSIARLNAKINAKKIQVAEEMRLLYVALTRAKNHLIITGSCDIANVKSTIPNSPFEIMQSTTYIDFLSSIIYGECNEQKNFLYKEIKLDQIKVISKDQTQRVLSGTPNKRLVDQLKSVYVLEQTPIIGANTILKNSVTSLTKNEEATIDFVPRKIFSEDRGVDYGTKFHNIMQKIDLNTKQHDDKNIEKCLEVLRPITQGKKILREIPFLQQLEKDGTQILVQGIIDMLIIDNEGVILVDYKSTRTTEQKLVGLSTPQMQMYAEAVTRSLGKGVRSLIYSTYHEKLIEIVG